MSARTIGQCAAALRSTALLGIGALVVASFATISTTGAASSSTSAQLAPPANDDWQNAAEVTAAPFTSSVDTTNATTDGATPPRSWNHRAHSVWYHVVAPSSERVYFSMVGTHYEHYIRLYRADSAAESPDGWTRQGDRVRGYDARPAAMVRHLTAGDHYFLMVSSYNTADGGQVNLLVRPAVKVGLTLARDGKINPDGSLTVGGMAKADHPVYVQVVVDLEQQNGDHVSRASELTAVNPEPGPDWEPWSVELHLWTPDHRFSPGLAQVDHASSRLVIFEVGPFWEQGSAFVLGRDFGRDVLQLN